MKTTEIRTRFLDFFAKHGHEVVSSSSLVPAGDPTLLFTNAGMVQFKNTFQGNSQRSCNRATSSQKCVRAGGKHNDLENVGRTSRHHTFFEMLGNFSFGDYFKYDAIHYAWEFLTLELGIDPKRLFITVYEKDDEAADIWLKDIGISPGQFTRIGSKDNFWSMGDTGPCGPCSEIFFDHGPEIPGGPPGSPDEDGDRFVEIWNLVFMQYNQDESGKRTDLPKLCVDTGMGLERTAAIMQGVHNNYDIDLFQNLINAASDATGCVYGSDEQADISLRVIVDHLRSVSFLLADGILPSNEGRGFVLRRILRRACRHGRLLGMNEAFIYRLVDPLAVEMGEHFDELIENKSSIKQIIRIEEERFIKTLDKGLKLVQQEIDAAGEGGSIPGKVLFTLYDTYGFPVDLTADIIKGQNVGLDMTGFESCMEEQRARARAAWGGSGEKAVPKAMFELRQQHGPTDFLGYSTLSAEGVATGLLLDGEKSVESLDEGDKGWLIANQTPFYGESGGQVGDAGTVECDTGIFRVVDTKKLLQDLHVHIGIVERGRIDRGSVLSFTVDASRRASIRRNHTATHLIHAVLRRTLGEHIKQAGSLVDPNRLRFDFSHFRPISDEEKIEIERLVNVAIWENSPVETKIMSQKDAIEAGAMALFGEKYGDEVRVVSAGFSTELCGGTHVSRTGDIGPFRVVSESGIAAGIRRIEAITGSAAHASFLADSENLNNASGLLKVQPAGLIQAISVLQNRLKEVEQELGSINARQSTGMLDELIKQAEACAGITLLTAEVDPDISDLRDFMDKAKGKLKSGVIVFGLKRGDKVQLIAGVTKDITSRFHAGNIVREVAAIVGGKGGGKPDMAMAGGSLTSKLAEALAEVPNIIQQAPE